MSDITIDKLALIIQKIKAKRAEISAVYDEQDSKLKQQLEVATHEINRLFKEMGVESVKTKYGTVSRTVKDRFWCSDWGPLLDYIRENDAVHLLQRRISDTAMKEWIADHPDDLPPALNSERTYEIKLYKPRKEL